ncbi:MAG: electron transport complex subunit RsxC [Actinomycetota bacterium]|nr:electron transport complex subunit RsxC [Actinomycetota bacterium]
MALRSFMGGVHPPDNKEATRGSATTRATMPDFLIVPMSQHLGAPCVPVVEKGDRVERGEVVGNVEAMVSAPIHSPVSGEVIAVGPTMVAGGQTVTAVTIAPDPEQDFDAFIKIPEGDLRDMVRAAGIVGLGGAAFPTTVKLSPPKDSPVHTVILNGCECEPFLTCDHRLMLERPDRVVAGARFMRDIIGAKRVVVGIEDNKPDAVAALNREAGSDVEILSLPTHYPQGAEKQLIYAVLGKEVAHGKLPASTGALVQNVGTAAAVADAIEFRRPLIERTMTVTGAVVRPRNMTVLLGTPISHLIAEAGGLTSDSGRIISGGPMTGMALADIDLPVTKGTSGIVALRVKETAPAVYGDQPCIRCGRCTDACPMGLRPFSLGIHANRSDWAACESLHVLDCIECGCCSFVCPTRRPLVQLFRRAKQTLLTRGSRS